MTTEIASTDETTTAPVVLQPEWENAPTLEDLKRDYTEAKVDHDDQVNKITNWLHNLNVTGSAKPSKKKGKSSIQPKLIRKQAEWRYAALSEPFLSTEDVFNIDPVTHGDKQAAVQNALILNNQFNTKLDKVRLIDESVRTVVDEGTLIYRVGWEFEEVEVVVDKPVIVLTATQDPQVAQQHQMLHQMMEEAPDDYNQLPPEVIAAHDATMEQQIVYTGEVTGYEQVTEMKTIKNHPTVEVCDYKDIIIDPTTNGDPSKLQFIIYSFETTKSELEKSGVEYKNLNAIIAENVSPLAQSDNIDEEPVPTFNFKDDPRKKLIAREYWGFYDIHGTGQTVPIVATWIGNTLIRMEENPFPDQEMPFIFVPYLPVRKSVYGEPDGELLADNQKVIGAVTRGMIDIMGRSANGQIGFREDALDVTNKRKYENGYDYTFNPTVDPRLAIINHTYPEIPQSAAYLIDSNNAEAESLTGVRSFNSTTNQGLGDTATEARGAMDAASKRELAILRRVAAGMKLVGRKIIAMNAEWLSDVEVVRVTNTKFVEIRRDDLAGNFDLKLSISTAEADNQKAQELAFMLQTMGNNMDMGMSKLILTDIARLRNMPDLAKSIETYEPQPDPLVQREKELQVELLEAQVANERAKAGENAVDIDLKSAKTATEEAKARNMNSDSDNKDLEFLEQEAGIPHQQELEKKDSDRQTQLDVKAVDALLKPEATPTT